MVYVCYIFLLNHSRIISQQNYIQTLWSDLQDPNTPLLDTLRKFYGDLLSKWTSEFNWCSTVFPAPFEMLVSLYKESLSSLTPPLDQCLRSHIYRSPTPIDSLIDLRNVLLEFVKCVIVFINYNYYYFL